MSQIKCTYDISLFSENANNMQFSEQLKNHVKMFVMYFSSEYKMMLLDLSTSMLILVKGNEVVKCVDHFIHVWNSIKLVSGNWYGYKKLSWLFSTCATYVTLKYSPPSRC